MGTWSRWKLLKEVGEPLPDSPTSNSGSALNINPSPGLSSGGGLGGGGEGMSGEQDPTQRPVELVPIFLDDAWAALSKAVHIMQKYSELDLYYNFKLEKKEKPKRKSLDSYE